jgi:lantibiotic modifying enzyme
MPSSLPSADNTVALFDARPFFEKALAFGLQQRIIDQAKIEVICTEAPKGMVQIARYFGTEYLRPELERAKDRIVNLISLHLEHSCHGDLRSAAELLRDNSLLSRSKAGSDMLKALIAMPQKHQQQLRCFFD